MSEKQDTFIGVTPTDIPADIKFNAKIDGWGLERIEGRSSSTVVYTITIIASNGSSWCLRRRYSEFRDNYLTMKHHYKKSKAAKFAFPGKTIFKTVSSANDRKELLQRYLNDLLDCHPPPVEVQYFLRITRKVLGLDNLGKWRYTLSYLSFFNEAQQYTHKTSLFSLCNHISIDIDFSCYFISKVPIMNALLSVP